MDNKFTELIKQWPETPSNQRDYSVGALYLLKLSGNQIMYRNVVAQLDRRHDLHNPGGGSAMLVQAQNRSHLARDFLDYQIQKYYNFRVQALTHSQVEEMQQKVDVIVAEHISLAANADEHKTGKRIDHDSLPDEIKAKYVENLSILQRMREDIADRTSEVSKAYRRGKDGSKVKLHSQEMMLAQVGSPLAIENAHRNLLDMEDDE